MGYLREDNFLSNVVEVGVKGISPVTWAVTETADFMSKERQKRRERVARDTLALQNAARKQQIDILAQAKATADTQADLAMRQSIQDKVAAQRAAATPGEVDVSLAATPDQPQSAIRAKRRKQFGFDSGGYSPGVSL